MTLARDVAARVLQRVETERAFAAAVLEFELTRSAQLSPRDHALTTELVYGSLRVMPWLLERLLRFAPKGIGKLDPRVRAHLVIAAYEITFTRVPAFAAVHEAVDAIRTIRGDRMAAFANAILRKLSADVSSIDDDARAQALVASAPAWLREALARDLSPDGADAFFRAGAAPPAVTLRVEAPEQRLRWKRELESAAPNARFEEGRVSPLAILMRGGGKPQRLPGWEEGAWSVQEEGAQLAALAVGARRGESVLDACAGRGNKTAILARATGEEGAVDAADALPSKLQRLREDLARLRLQPRSTYAVDWRVGSGEVVGSYDRVLVDAPCSGIGTLRRRPEIALRRRREDLTTLAATQIAIAARAAEHVRPGGTLVYVVCSVLREECEDVIEALIRARPELAPDPFGSQAAAVAAVAGAHASSFRLLPHVHATDGYFVAQLRSRGPTL
ncbi:MAG TPA: transcription antitermination factor NusB [Polyangiaceae bacterium]|nr:transcription antitermination factor NusB [Polyangiaceae bacterium]